MPPGTVRAARYRGEGEALGAFGCEDTVGALVGTGTGDTVAVGTAVGALGVGVAAVLVGTGLGIAVGAAGPVGLGTGDGAAGPVEVGAVDGVRGVGVADAAALTPLSAVTALAEEAAELAP